MPAAQDPRGSEGDVPPKLRLTQRALLAVPRLRRSRSGTPLGERLRDAMLKPAPAGAAPARASGARPSVEELEARVRYTDDTERLFGLIAAPLAAMIGMLVTSDLIAHDPPALLANGHANKLHVSVGLYHELELVVLALALAMLVTALLRKRLLLGGAMALYGLAVFNLHYWGFGIPFVMAGAWYLVRAYRAQRDLKEATGQGPRRVQSTQAVRPRPNKRYTPPA